MSRRLLYLLCTLVWLPVVLSDTWRSSWTKEDFPNPRYDGTACGRTRNSSWVCDPSNVLTSRQGDIIDLAIDSMQEDLDCACSRCNHPFPIGIALVPRIDDGSGRPISSKTRRASYTRTFARFLRDVSWNFGQCDDDIIIMVSRGDRQIYTALGKRTLTILTAECTQEIYKEGRHYFSNDQFYDGLRYLISEYRDVLIGARTCAKSGGLSSGTIAGIVVGSIVALFGGVICCFLCARGKCNSGGGGGRSYGLSSHHHHHHHYGGWGGGGGGGGDSGGDGGGGGGDGGGGDF